MRLLGPPRSGIISVAGTMTAFFFAVASCDPTQDPAVSQNGPPFLIVGLTSQQPSPPELGVSVYIQARGGNYVGILTHGCLHSLGTLTNVDSSCGQLPGTDPLYILVQPTDQQCIVEARLYSLCDDAAPISQDESLFNYCDWNGTLVTTVIVPVSPPVPDVATWEDAGPIGYEAGDLGAGQSASDP